MAKTISFTWNDKNYTLEFTRASVVKLEKSGFEIQKAADLPVSTIPDLFAGAFVAHHPLVKQATIDEIYANMPDKTQLVEKLVEMYVDVINTLLDEPSDETKKISWEMTE